MITVIKEYDKQVRPVKDTNNKWVHTRADKPTRYAHYEADKLGHTDLSTKERRAVELIKMALKRAKKPVVSCSFGIDSIVTLYLTRKALVELGRNPSDIDVVWNNTLNEFPEVRKYAAEIEKVWNLRLIVTKPKKVLKQIIDDNGGITSDYFTARKGDRRQGQPLSEKCCGTLKHEPMRRALRENNWDLVINGLRADESRQRLLAALRDGEFFYSISEWKALVVRPILWFKDSDIWEYVAQEGIPFNELYRKNLIRKYPENVEEIVKNNRRLLEEIGVDPTALKEQQVKTVERVQALVLEKLGFEIFLPRTGCQMCPIPVKYGYLQWMREYYPKAYNGMVYNLGYGKALLDMVPNDVKAEIQALTGIDLTAEDAAEHLKEILEAKPCTFDRF